MPALTSPSIPPELRDSYHEGNLIIVVGPELAAAAGLPTIEELTRLLLELAIEQELPVDHAHLSRWVEQGRSDEVLGQLQRRMGEGFQRQVERRLSDHGAAIPELARSRPRPCCASSAGSTLTADTHAPKSAPRNRASRSTHTAAHREIPDERARAAHPSRGARPAVQAIRWTRPWDTRGR